MIYVTYSTQHDGTTIAQHSASPGADASRHGQPYWSRSELRGSVGTRGNGDHRTCRTTCDLAQTIGPVHQSER